MIDVSLEPFAMEAGRLSGWQMLHKVPGWYGEAWINLPDCLVMALLVLALTTPWLINKKPVKHQSPGYYPLTFWFAVNLLLVAANAWHGLWMVAGFGLIASLIITAFAVRGARRPESAISDSAGGR